MAIITLYNFHFMKQHLWDNTRFKAKRKQHLFASRQNTITDRRRQNYETADVMIPPFHKEGGKSLHQFHSFFFFFKAKFTICNSQSDKTGQWKLVKYFMITEIGRGKNPCGKIAIITSCNFHYPNQHSRDDTRLQTKSCVNFPTGMTELMNST